MNSTFTTENYIIMYTSNDGQVKKLDSEFDELLGPAMMRALHLMRNKNPKIVKVVRAVAMSEVAVVDC